MVKWSAYNIIEEKYGSCLIYNTRTSAIVKMDASSFHGIDELVSNTFTSIANNEHIQSLYKQGILVDSSTDENELVKKRYLDHYYDKQRLNLTILPIESCNLTCPYCFIYNYTRSTMSKELAEGVFNFIKHRLSLRDRNKKFTMNINWYGGEPLLRTSFILQFMAKLSAYIDELNLNTTKEGKIELVGSIVTNGVFLTSEVVTQLCRFHVRSFQVTFDGGKEFHDKTRCDSKGCGSFDFIMKNLSSRVQLNDQFLLSLRINFMKDSLSSIIPLIDQLKELIGDDKRFLIYCRPVYHFETVRDDISRIEDNIFGLEEGLDEQQRFTEYIEGKSSSLTSRLPTAKSSWCIEDNDYSFIIGANGLVYKCDTLIGDVKFSIGKLSNGEFIPNERNKKWNADIFQLPEFSKCVDCKLLPICYGGCKRNALEHRRTCLITEKQIRKSMNEYLERR